MEDTTIEQDGKLEEGLSTNEYPDFEIYPGEQPSKLKKILTAWKQKKLKLPQIVTLLKLLVFVLIGALIASNIVLWYSYYDSKDSDQPTELEFTAEFQMNLFEEDWKNRDKQMRKFFAFFEQVSGYPFSSSDLIENYRVQTYFRQTQSKCGGSWDVDFRLRNYFMGPAANTTTLDAKINSLSYDEGLTAPIEPSDEQLEHSFQKLEHDIHPCDDKYSRESRVQDIPYQPVFTTCGDIHNLYPYIWSSRSNKKPISESSPEYWYTGVYEGVFDNGITFKSDITLQYHSMQDTIDGFSPTNGEYSLRIWSTHLGHGPWNQTSFDEVNSWYQQLLQHFSSNGDYPCKTKS